MELRPASVADIESILSDTVEKVADIKDETSRIKILSELLPEMSSMMKAIVTSQSIMAEAATSMAKTFDRAEVRQAQLEVNNTKLYEHKGVSDGIFKMVVGTLLVVIVALVVWGTGLNLKGSFTNLEISQKQNTRAIQGSIEDSADQISNEVSKK